MDREQDIPFIVENGIIKPEQDIPLRDGDRGILRVTGPIRSNENPRIDPKEFWKNKTIEELAAEQGVRPINDIAELRGDWPPEDSIDEFLSEVRKGRK